MWARAADLKFLSVHRKLIRNFNSKAIRIKGFLVPLCFPSVARVPRWFTTFRCREPGFNFRRGALAAEHDPEKWIPVFGKDHAPTIA